MQVMAALSVVAPLLVGIIVESVTSRVGVWLARLVGIVLRSSLAMRRAALGLT